MPTADEILASADTPPAATQPTAPTNELGDTLSAPPPPAPTNELGDTLPVQTTPDTPATTPASQDPEMVAGAAHQQETSSFLNRALSVMAGDKTHHVITNKDGSVSVHVDDSTEKEKWMRIAVAVLGGAARGLAAGQGPGGAGKAVAAGFDAGMKIPQQASAAAFGEADSQNKLLQDKGNLVLTQQRGIAQTMDNKANKIKLTKEQQDQSNADAERFDNSPNSQKVGTFASMDEAAKSPNVKLILQHHPNGMLRTTPAYTGDGDIAGVHAWVVDKAWADRMNDKPVAYLEQVPSTDPDAKPTAKISYIPVNGKTNAEADTWVAAHHTAFQKAQADWAATKDKLNPPPKTAAEITLAKHQALNPTDPTKALADADKEIQANEIAQKTAGRNITANPYAPAPGAPTATGEDYLKTSGIAPAAWQQIRSTANGDIKIPTASRSPQNMAFRSAVMNYDPTFTDARYQAKQDFKTKGDSNSIMQLSTAMEHADRALTNSQRLGNSVSLLTGKNLSGPAADYDSDRQFFTGEAGKLVMGGVVGEKEGERIRQNISSPVQSIRDSALREVLHLTGGKVGALFQKYKGATGQELPVQDFFDKPTLERLNRFGVTNAPEPTSQTQFGPTSQYIPGKIYQVKDSSGNTVPIDGSKMATAWQRDPKLTVLGVQ